MKRKISIFIFVLFTFAIFGLCLNNIKANDELIKEIKTFLNTKEIVIDDQMKEDKNTIVYKVHDVTNDKYYKIASYEGEINWYDDIQTIKHKVIETDLENKLKKMSDEETIEVMVELIFDDTQSFNKLAESYPEYFNKNNEMKSNLSKEEKELADTKRRELLKDTFTSFNKETLKDYSISKVSEYTPFVTVNMTKKEIYKLAESGKVIQMGLLYKMVDDDVNYGNLNKQLNEVASATINNNPIYSTGVNQIHNLGEKGSGVKIGQIESNIPNMTNSYLSNSSIIPMLGCATSQHATEVAGILVGSNGVAPNATLYSACGTYDYDSSYGSFVAGINWLISKGVSVINMSAFVDSELDVQSYRIVDRYVDALIHYTDIVFVKAAGNNPNPTYCLGQFVTSPGKAFNVITVGNLAYSDSSFTNIVNAYMNSTSCYNTPSTAYSQSNKPDLVAPGTDVNFTNVYGSTQSGTSFSAPLVAGTAALILGTNPNLAHKSAIIKSALIATARPLTYYPRGYLDYNKSGYPSLRYNHNDQTGAGILNAKGAYDLVRWGQRVGYTYYGSGGVTRTLSSGAGLTVAIAWTKPNELTNISTIYGYNNYGTDQAHDLDLEILGPGNQKINKSSSWYNNIEFISFTANYGTGDYKFQITYYSPNGNPNPISVGLSWW